MSSYFDSLLASLFVLSLLGLAVLEDEDEDGASALGAGVVVELLELEAGGDWGAIVTDVDEEEGGGVLDAEGPGVADELLELDGALSARAEGCVAVEDEDDEDLPGAPAGPAGPCRSQAASARALALKATISGIKGRVMKFS
ncbi:MAG TPA: hypothetical protein VHN19_16580 [Burkholderiales bacterium]|jgi:hypothetical protein|nr:hypothetical protein [Burkholderiales bacterium]